jgi:hypothetical protein
VNSRRSLPELRTAASARLRDRRVEINRTVAHRALSTAPPTGSEQSGYLEELRGTIALAVDYAFGAVEQGIDRVGPMPSAVPTQAESAARSQVGLEVVLQRYASGYSTLTDFLYQEVRTLGGDLHYPALQRELTALFDRLVVEVSESYRRAESRAMPSSSRARRLERVRKLLAGELLDAAELDYDLGGWHLALVGRHLGDLEILHPLGTALDRRVLAVEVDETIAWAWLGGRRPFGPDELKQIATHQWPDEALVASGSSAHGIGGWRLTHRQASKAIGVAARQPKLFTAYDQVALSAAILEDEDLVNYLEDSVLTPLSGAGGRGDILRDTVRTYLASGDNVSSAASALGVSRQTVTLRLRDVEEKLSRTISSYRTEIEVALTIDALRG